MIVVVRQGTSSTECAQIRELLSKNSGDLSEVQTVSWGDDLLFCLPDNELSKIAEIRLQAHPAVRRIVPIATPYQLASRDFQGEKTLVKIGNLQIGGPRHVIMAGPCSVESESQIMASAHAAHEAGAQMLRGGAFKPRTSPYAFQGLGLPGVRLLARAGAEVGLPIVTEVMDPQLVPDVAELADLLQVGSRNMQNFPLLRAVGHSKRPVLLKRGFAATVEEWLLAAEYILAEGNQNVILCERGVRSFDSQTRNILDLSCIPLLATLSHLPVLIDPSHATGRRDLVVPMGVAAIAAGADGLLVEMHPHPDEALSDGEQSITPAMLSLLVNQADLVRSALSEATDAGGLSQGLSLLDFNEAVAIGCAG
jgi:3-deoxy-7-phosphoheptulonate synthase